MDSDTQLINGFIDHLSLGKVIDLQFGNANGIRIKPTVIGIDLGRYFIVKFPCRLNPKDYKDLLIAGNSVIVRYILEGEHGECVAFATTIEHVLTSPEKLLFLNYPSRIENRQLRKKPRQKTHLPAQILQNEMGTEASKGIISGYIVDISENGCQFSFKADAQKSKIEKEPIQIVITLVGQQDVLPINAHVKNIRQGTDSTLVGIKFDDSSLKDVLSLLDDMQID